MKLASRCTPYKPQPGACLGNLVARRHSSSNPDLLCTRPEQHSGLLHRTGRQSAPPVQTCSPARRVVRFLSVVNPFQTLGDLAPTRHSASHFGSLSHTETQREHHDSLQKSYSQLLYYKCSPRHAGQRSEFHFNVRKHRTRQDHLSRSRIVRITLGQTTNLECLCRNAAQLPVVCSIPTGSVPLSPSLCDNLGGS